MKGPRRVKNIPPRLMRSINLVRLSGQQLSNIAFNLSQRESNPHMTDYECRLLRRCQVRWDKACRSLWSLL